MVGPLALGGLQGALESSRLGGEGGLGGGHRSDLVVDEASLLRQQGGVPVPRVAHELGPPT
jgi:hypothetical protein